MKTKKCSNKNCKNPIKPLSEFSKNKRANDGLNCWCKGCVKKYKKEYQEKYPWKITLQKIKQRCENPNVKDYKNYGGRGIKCLITEKEMKEIWFRDKAYLMEKHSIDRKKNNRNYTLNNCEYIELAENSVKDKRKPILQYNLGGEFIKEWGSLAEAGRILNISHISSNASGKRKTAGGFVWRFKL